MCMYSFLLSLYFFVRYVYALCFVCFVCSFIMRFRMEVCKVLFKDWFTRISLKEASNIRTAWGENATKKLRLKPWAFPSFSISINFCRKWTKITSTLLFNGRHNWTVVGMFANFSFWFFGWQIFFAVSNMIANLVILMLINLSCFCVCIRLDGKGGLWRCIKIPLESACFVVLCFCACSFIFIHQKLSDFYCGRCMCVCCVTVVAEWFWLGISVRSSEIKMTISDEYVCGRICFVRAYASVKHKSRFIVYHRKKNLLRYCIILYLNVGCVYYVFGFERAKMK